MTGETFLLLMASTVPWIVNALVQRHLNRQIWRAIDDLRGKRAPPNEEARRSGERHVLRPGATPDVRTIDDSGERVRPGRPLAR